MISLTRRYHFPASHRLHSVTLSDAENAALYGKCNNPFGHGHDYVLAVTLAGEPDSATGLLVPIAKLDQLVSDKILRLFAYRNMNVDVPQFAGVVPTTENMVTLIASLLELHWREYVGDSRARPVRVHIQETDRNGFELLMKTPAEDRPAEVRNENESVMVHA